MSIEYDKQLYMLIFIFDQVNAALMNIRDNEHLSGPKHLNAKLWILNVSKNK